MKHSLKKQNLVLVERMLLRSGLMKQYVFGICLVHLMGNQVKNLQISLIILELI